MPARARGLTVPDSLRLMGRAGTGPLPDPTQHPEQQRSRRGVQAQNGGSDKPLPEKSTE